MCLHILALSRTIQHPLSTTGRLIRPCFGLVWSLRFLAGVCNFSACAVSILLYRYTCLSPHLSWQSCELPLGPEDLLQLITFFAMGKRLKLWRVMSLTGKP